MIMQHFIEKGIPLQKKYSSNKLKEFIGNKKQHIQKEKTGIAITKKLISENNNLHKWTELTKHKKQDDLADSFKEDGI